MKHVDPKSLLWLPDRKIIKPCAFIPGLAPAPPIIGAAREVSPGSTSWSTPGTYSWVIPRFNNLYLRCNGAGGGGSGAGWTTPDYRFMYMLPNGQPTAQVLSGASYTGGAGVAGGVGQITIAGVLNMVANGGAGGPGGSIFNYYGYTTSPMTPGNPGQSSGGNYSNSAGTGSAGGNYGYDYVSCYQEDYAGGMWPPYAQMMAGYVYGGKGGAGGSCESKFTVGQLAPDLSVQIVVQGGGAVGWQYTTSGGALPTAGAAASVYAEWN